MTSILRRGSADKTIPHTRMEENVMVLEIYQIVRKLGEGAFGKVYQVRHKETNQQWAMKSVNKEKAGSSAIKLLEREVAILKRVSHPSIIQLNEVIETPKKMFLIMELCEGGELADALRERKFFPEFEVKIITEELASAIAYLHKNDIVHRDLKLENILLSQVPNPSFIKYGLQIRITDFGLSITKSGVGHDNMMQDVCGTPNYMAPEIIDNKTYSQQCDVWALGVIVYTLFCGYPPFRASDNETLYEHIKKGEIDFTSSDVWNDVSDEAKDCIMRMLKKDPAHRLTASEVVNHPWLTGQDGTPTNVLQLMREWKDDLLRNPNVEADTDTVVINNASAINGDLEQINNNIEITNNNEIESNGRKDSGGTKKPGSGEKRQSGTHMSNTHKTSGPATKAINVRMPTSRSVPKNLGMSTLIRPVAQHVLRTGSNNLNKQMTSAPKATSRSTMKESSTKK